MTEDTTNAEIDPADPLDNLLDEDLMDIYQAIRDGAKTPAQALDFDDDAMDTTESVAQGYLEGKRIDLAGPLYGFLLRMDPGRASAWRGMGVCLQDVGELEAARHCYLQSVLADGSDPISRVYFGECLCRLGAL